LATRWLQVREKQPNVVFVLVDDAGYGDFACNGNPVIKTPNLDKLHDESVRFPRVPRKPNLLPYARRFDDRPI
jgi:hypothetical protein